MFEIFDILFDLIFDLIPIIYQHKIDTQALERIDHNLEPRDPIAFNM